MKKYPVKFSMLCVICLTFLIPLQSFSQASIEKAKDPSDTLCFVKPQVKILKYYTKDELNKMAKLDLIDVYKSRLAYLIEILPFISLHPEPGSTFHDMAIPETEGNIAHLEKERENKQVFVNSLFATLDDVIPYSEKTNIIWAILYFDEMIKKSDYIKDKDEGKKK